MLIEMVIISLFWLSVAVFGFYYFYSKPINAGKKLSKNDYDKVLRIINSCTTLEQLVNVNNWVNNTVKKYKIAPSQIININTCIHLTYLMFRNSDEK